MEQKNKECLALQLSSGRLVTSYAVVKLAECGTLGVVSKLYENGTLDVAIGGRLRETYTYSLAEVLLVY